MKKQLLSKTGKRIMLLSFILLVALITINFFTMASQEETATGLYSIGAFLSNFVIIFSGLIIVFIFLVGFVLWILTKF